MYKKNQEHCERKIVLVAISAAANTDSPELVMWIYQQSTNSTTGATQ
jgi:hypothetical protein